MPERLEEHLKNEARKRGYSGERFDRFVYGTLQNVEKEREQAGNKPSEQPSEAETPKKE